MRKTAKKLPRLTAEQRRIIAEQPEPSAASLRAIPELDIKNAKYFGRGPEGLQAALEYMRAKRGRPAKGATPAGSSTRSLRLTDATWEALEQRAQLRHTTVHALLREAVANELGRQATEEPVAPPASGARRKRKAG